MPASIRSRKWCFTSFCSTPPAYLSSEMKYLVFQQEKAKTGRLHYQCFVYFKNEKSLRACKEHLPPGVHLEVCKGTVDDNYDYCTKEDSRVDGPWEYGKKPANPGDKIKKLQEHHKEILEYMKGCERFSDLLIHPNYSRYVSGKMDWARSAYHIIRNQIEPVQLQLRSWQSDLLYKVAMQDTSRSVWWIVDIKGGRGKTTFTKYCRHHFNAFTPQLNHKTASFLYDRQELVIIDIPRHTGDELVPYGLIESLKNGFITSDKYVPLQKEFNPPMVIIFSNHQPDLDKLSADRWRVFTLNSLGNELVKQ